METIGHEELQRRFDAMFESMGACRAVDGYRYRICEDGEDDCDYAKPGFDDSGWTWTKTGVPVRRDQGRTWYRFSFTLPERNLGIPVMGDSFRIAHFFFAPVDIYVDGVKRFSERSWMDFKSPECTVDPDARPGRRFDVAVVLHLGEFCYWNGGIGMGVLSDRLEELEFSLRSFRDEMAYAEGFPEVAGLLPAVHERIGTALSDPGDATRIDAAIEECREMLRPMEVRAKSRTVHLVGHAHIDMNWFWSMDETLDVIRRDFDTMTRFLEEFPDFCFSQSQCATYDIAERMYPEIFARIREFVAQGRWEPTASTWVEGDLNMACGESIVRHILLSKRYLQERFGFEPRIMWCPDTFGHSANVPQILKKSGIDRYFFLRCGPGVDQSLDENDSRLRDAHHDPLFRWTGIDGSTVTASNLIYGCDVWTAGLTAQSNRMKDAYDIDQAMFVYGTGDHGGGPTRRDIQRIRRLAASPTVPTLRFSTTERYFTEIENNGSVEKLPNHTGELNAIFDGCYTTHGDIKRYNRLCENALSVAESLSAAAGTASGAATRIEAAWRSTLFNQFHDIFDGSGVKKTYEYSSCIAEAALADLADLTADRLAKLAARVGGGLAEPGEAHLVFNPAAYDRAACVALPWSGEGIPSAFDAKGRRLPVQPTAEVTSDGDAAWLVEVPHIPSLGYTTVTLMSGAPVSVETPERPFAPIVDDGSSYRFDTTHYSISVDKGSGEIDTLFDKRTRRFVVRKGAFAWRNRNGTLNQFQVHDEEPAHMSSWSIGRIGRIRSLISGASSTIIEDGPVRRVLRFEHAFDESRIVQDIIFEHSSPRIDFRTQVEWGEYGDFDRAAPMLRVVFVPDLDPVEALYEIPFGTLARPCQDREQPSLRFVDVVDAGGGYGFAVMNDGKHGHRVKGNVLELALIRSGWLPDQRSDIGHHEFTYSILPHPGETFESGVVAESAFLNLAMRTAPCLPGDRPDRLPSTASFARIESGTAVLSALKCAESGEGWVVRLYDPTGRGGSTRLRVHDPAGRRDFRHAEETDLLERPIGAVIPLEEGCLDVTFSPYEIRTFRLIGGG